MKLKEDSSPPIIHWLHYTSNFNLYFTECRIKHFGFPFVTDHLNIYTTPTGLTWQYWGKKFCPSPPDENSPATITFYRQFIRHWVEIIMMWTCDLFRAILLAIIPGHQFISQQRTAGKALGLQKQYCSPLFYSRFFHFYFGNKLLLQSRELSLYSHC